MIKSFKLNPFVEINVNKTFLKRMQVGDINLIKETKEIEDTEFRPEIIINISLENFSLKDWYRTTNETGYFEKNGNVYYRNCFSIANINGGEILYSGFYSKLRILESNLYCKLNFSINEPIKVNIKVTPLYLLESRGRLAENPSFESFLNDLILVLSILKGKIPMHAAAIDTNKGGFLFMGLPNTGKTTTSNLLKKKLNGVLISEDITFIDINTLKIIGSPYTSKINFPDKFISTNKLKYIITLYRDNYKRDFYNFVEGNNLYEFTFLKQLNIKALFLYGSKNFPGLAEIEMKYLEGIKKIVEKTKEIETVGVRMEDYEKYLISKIKHYE